jgi:hypothetical protein
MKTFNIEIPDGYEIDQQNSEFTKGLVVFKKIESNLPKNWGELENISGYYVGDCCDIEYERDTKTYIDNRNMFVTERQANASIAFAQLSQFRQVYRQGWVPDWNDEKSTKWCVNFHKDKVIVDVWYTTHKFLSFQSKKIAEEFLENFHKLIKQANPLMS